jgi:hypothetical protein
MYEFSVSSLPLQKKIKVCKTVEIRFKLVQNDKYEVAKYYYNFFQPEGKGYIQTENRDILIPNDTYELIDETFSLDYTSYCLDKQTIDISIRDNFNQECKLSFSFENNRDNPFPLLVKRPLS